MAAIPKAQATPSRTPRPRAPRAPKVEVTEIVAPVVEEYEDEAPEDDFGGYDGEIREIDPRDIKKHKESTLYVRNNTNMRIVWDPKSTALGTSSLILSQEGTPDSIQELPWDVANHPAFLRFWRQGKVTVSDDPALEENLEALAMADVETERLQQISAEHSLDRQHNRTLAFPGIQAPATGPGRSFQR